MSRYWIGVVSAEHAAKGVEQGIAQIGHRKRSGLARMHQGDRLIYYSPKVSLDSAGEIPTFTSIGEVADEEISSAHNVARL